MNAKFDHTTEAKNRKNSRGISDKMFTLIIGVLLVFGVLLMMYYYRAAKSGTLAPTSTPAPPTATPILDANGNPAPMNAWFPSLQGESFFAMAADGKTLLVDAGTREDADALLNFLNGQAVKTLDAVFLTLAEERYLGGMEAVINTFPVGGFYLTPETHADPRCKQLLALLEEKKVPVQQVHASFVSTVAWAENAELRILSPHDVSYGSAADESLMLRLSYGSSEILLAGSAGELAERMTVKALPNQLLHADVLKLADQGSAAGTSERFLGAVKPDIAIVLGAVSEELPANAVLARLKQKGITLLATDTVGTIHIVLDGAAAKVVE